MIPYSYIRYLIKDFRFLIKFYISTSDIIYQIYDVVVVVLGLYVPPTAKVIRRLDLGLKSHPKDWRSPGSNSRALVYKAGSLTARPQRLLDI